MRRSRFFKHMPTSQSIQENRYLRPLRRYLHHHYLWQFNRRGVAGGMAVGLFFGILSPIAQILLGAIGSVIFRVNLPVAAFATLVTNPFTVPPLYYAAYRLGKWILGEDSAADDGFDPNAVGAMPELKGDVSSWWHTALEWVQGVGPQLMLGLLVFATVSALLGYVLVSVIWQLQARYRWKQRVRRIQQSLED